MLWASISREAVLSRFICIYTLSSYFLSSTFGWTISLAFFLSGVLGVHETFRCFFIVGARFIASVIYHPLYVYQRFCSKHLLINHGRDKSGPYRKRGCLTGPLQKKSSGKGKLEAPVQCFQLVQKCVL